MARFKSLWATISKLNVAYVLVLSLIVKALINSITYPDFLITIPVLAYEGYKLYIKHKTPAPLVLDAEVRRELDNIKSKINAETLNKNIKQNATVPRYF